MGSMIKTNRAPQFPSFPCRDLLGKDALDDGNAYGSTVWVAAGTSIDEEIRVVNIIGSDDDVKAWVAHP